jgi:hypothetical protein
MNKQKQRDTDFRTIKDSLNSDIQTANGLWKKEKWHNRVETETNTFVQ